MSIGPAIALAAAAMCLLGGCTVIRTGNGDTARVRVYPGVAIVKLTPRDGSEVVSTRSFGLSVNRSALSLGWSSADTALIPQGECEIILWKPAEGASAAMAKLLPNAKLCTVERGK